MATVGEILREARESRRVSLEEAHHALGIPAHYLEAIERNHSPLVGDEFYLIPFVRRYGDFLELDGPELVARFLQESARRESEPVPAARLRAFPRAAWWALGAAVVVAGAALARWLF